MPPMPPLGYSKEPTFQARRDGAFRFFVQLFVFVQAPKKYSVVSECLISKKLLHGACFLGASTKMKSRTKNLKAPYQRAWRGGSFEYPKGGIGVMGQPQKSTFCRSVSKNGWYRVVREAVGRPRNGRTQKLTRPIHVGHVGSRISKIWISSWSRTPFSGCFSKKWKKQLNLWGEKGVIFELRGHS